VDTITIPGAVAIMIGLAALDLGPIPGMDLFPGMGLIAALPLSASLRKAINRQKNHRSDEKYAVSQ
jgi:uncharacterized membrane protein